MSLSRCPPRGLATASVVRSYRASVVSATHSEVPSLIPIDQVLADELHAELPDGLRLLRPAEGLGDALGPAALAGAELSQVFEDVAALFGEGVFAAISEQ